MSEESQELQTVTNAFSDNNSFEMAQRIAVPLSKSELIPKSYQGNIPSIMVALELGNRTGVSPIMVMQNLHVIQGKPSWSSSFIIAVINKCSKFTMPLNFTIEGEGDKRTCIAFTTGIDGERYESPTVSMEMARAEGWLSKSGSKWKTMPELMLRYRAAAFFGRLYCPELLMGMQADEELNDIKPVPPKSQDQIEGDRMKQLLSTCETVEDVELLEEANPDMDAELFENRKKELKTN